MYSSNTAPIAIGSIVITKDDQVDSGLSVNDISNIKYPYYKVDNRTLLEYQSATGYDYIDGEEKRIIEVPNVIETISRMVFYYNHNVDKVILSDYVDTIDYGAFMDCWAREIVMPATMDSIGSSAFNRMTISSMDIPYGVTTIEDYFMHNTYLKTIVIPHSVTEIGYKSFGNCYNLCSIYIPDSVTAIDSQAFMGSNAPITIWGNNNSFLQHYANTNSEQNGNNIIRCKLGYNITDTTLNAYTGSDTTVQIPFGIGLNSIADNAFKNNTTVESVSISSTITSIGSECFSGCTSLTSIVIPDSVESVGTNAFEGIPNLTVFCNEGSFIEAYCIENNISIITDYDISDGVLNSYHGSEANVVIPSNLSITEIGGTAFSRNQNIVSVVIPEGVSVLGTLSFSQCTALTNVILPSTIRNISSFAFHNCDNLNNLSNTSFIKKIESYAFSGCTSLTAINLIGAETISYSVFNNCNNLNSVILGSSISSIGDNVFNGCPSITISCYADTIAYQYAVDNNIPYILLDETTVATFSLKPSSKSYVADNILSESVEDQIVNSPENELYCHVQQKYNGEITEDDIDDIVSYMSNNGWW